MINLPDDITTLLVSGFMGIVGGLITIPINAVVSWLLKREEQSYQHKLDLIAKQRELLLQHKLEMQRKHKDNEVAELKKTIDNIEERLAMKVGK